MEENDYRLERWLAILLSLLFFLPFVARADEIVFTDLYTDEIPYKEGDSYLAIAKDRLVPVKIHVEPTEEPSGDTHHGTFVQAPGFDEVWLVRGKKLRSGPIVRAVPDALKLFPNRTTSAIALGAARYELSYRCAAKQCTLVLSSDGKAQDLTVNFADISFAGDLDRDGRLDLIVNATLWLSTAARNGQLVGPAAQLAAAPGGC